MKTLDTPTKVIIIRFIQRFAVGGTKKSIKALKDGVFEIKIKYGPGYRLYFADLGSGAILLLMGGDKKSQSKDIKKAKTYWRDYGKQTQRL